MRKSGTSTTGAPPASSATVRRNAPPFTITATTSDASGMRCRSSKVRQAPPSSASPRTGMAIARTARVSAEVAAIHSRRGSTAARRPIGSQVVSITRSPAGTSRWNPAGSSKRTRVRLSAPSAPLGSAPMLPMASIPGSPSAASRRRMLRRGSAATESERIGDCASSAGSLKRTPRTRRGAVGCGSAGGVPSRGASSRVAGSLGISTTNVRTRAPPPAGMVHAAAGARTRAGSGAAPVAGRAGRGVTAMCDDVRRSSASRARSAAPSAREATRPRAIEGGMVPSSTSAAASRRWRWMESGLSSRIGAAPSPPWHGRQWVVSIAAASVGSAVAVAVAIVMVAVERASTRGAHAHAADAPAISAAAAIVRGRAFRTVAR
jgi:hypothetical protein